MKHLTDEQLTGVLDAALPPRERAAADAHLSRCEACRARLAEASALERSLGEALAHEPSEAYFSDFAERVERRIAAAGAPAKAAPGAPKPRTSWLFTPRGLAFAGSTAALLATAGIAWMRFHNENDVARALRVAAPSPVGAKANAPAPAGEASLEREPHAAPPAAPQSPSRGLATSNEALRAHQVQRQANGEELPVEPREQRLEEREEQRPGAPAPSPSAIAQMKRRALAPARDENAQAPTSSADQVRASEKPADAARDKLEAAAPSPQLPYSFVDSARSQAAKRGSTWGSMKSLYGGSPSSAPAPQASTREQASGSSSRGGLADEARLDLGAASDTLASCGTVRDARGHAIAGAQVTAMHDGVRTARTGPDGRFCLETLRVGDTLTVLRVGFEPLQVVVGRETSLALALQPVGTLSPQSGMLLGKRDGGAPGFAEPSRPPVDNVMRGVAGAAPEPDPYADQPPAIAQLVSEAREVSNVARSKQTVAAFEHAAALWLEVAALVTAPATFDARFQSLAAEREACRIDPAPERVARFKSDLASFVQTSPSKLRARATALRWQSEWGQIRALYR